jgi:fatty acid desaturase
MKFEREPGFLSAAMAINYAIVCVFFLLPLLLIWLVGLLPGAFTVVLSFLGAMTILTYRYSQSIWLGFYFFVTSENLHEENCDKVFEQQQKRRTPEDAP